MQFPPQYPVQDVRLTKEEIDSVRLRRWLDLKRERDAERLAREGMRGYRG